MQISIAMVIFHKIELLMNLEMCFFQNMLSGFVPDVDFFVVYQFDVFFETIVKFDVYNN